MRPEDETAELRSVEERSKKALLKLADEVLAVLSQDIEKFPLREVRRRFVSAPRFAESMDDRTIARLKKELEARAGPVRDRVIEAMSEEDRWLAGLEYDGPGRSLAENTRLWAPTEEAAALVREVLRAYGFPNADNPPVEYKMPTYFVSGKYLPTLAERYWRLIREIREARARIAEVEDRLAREALGRRWDDVEPGDGA